MTRPVPPPDFSPFPRDQVERSIPERWRLVVERHATRPALRTADGELSYAELDRRSDALARSLAARLPGGGRNVAIRFAPVADQIVAALGVLKAGHAFVPLDVRHPAAYNDGLVERAGAAFVLSEGDLPAAAAGPAGFPPIAPAARAYLLFTSGSTGRPKGVAQTHRNVLHNVFKYANAIALAPSDRHTLPGSLSFAAAMSDLFGALLSGACLCAYALQDHGVGMLTGWLRDERITVWHAVPTVFRRWTDIVEGDAKLPDLRLLKLAGEPVVRDDVDRFRRLFRPPAVLLNSLGATELNTIRQFFIAHDTPLPDGGLVPVGYEVPETRVSLSNGEIVVHSAFLPDGYWDEPGLSSAVFRPGDHTGERAFHTGDAGELLPDGCLLHRGRRDHRIKLRGITVEPAEIEDAVRASGLARDAAVVACDDPLRLVAFVSGCADPGLLRAHLAARLPAPLLPASIHVLDTFPVLAGGKVDRRTLATLLPASTPVASADALEAEILTVWRRVLRRETIGCTDRFDALGGDSLRAVELVAALRRDLRVDLSPAVLAEAPTVRELARRVRQPQPEERPVVLLSAGGAKTPLFLVPGAGSDVIQLAGFARCFAPERKVHGLRMRGLDGAGPPDTSVEAIASYLTAALCAVWPRGSCVVGGTSFGGIVALEIARRLRAAGRDVPLVLLLDTPLPGHRDRGAWARHPLHLALARFLPLGAQETLSLANLRLGLRQRRERRNPPAPVARYMTLLEAGLTALRGFEPAAYDGPVLLLRARQQAPWLRRDPTLGWRRLLPRLQVVTCPGGHLDQLSGAGAVQAAGAALRVLNGS